MIQCKGMKLSLSILILSVIVFIVIFGAFSMIGMEHGRNCWVAVANGSVCPDNMSPLASINFDFNALEKFSLAVFQNTFLLVLLLAISLFIITGIFILKENLIKNHLRYVFYFANLIFKLSRDKFNYWLSLLENSPSFSYARHS